MLRTEIPMLDELLDVHREALGGDFTGYRNHTYRVVNLCSAVAGERAELDKIVIAAAFHDIGVWTDRTFDYLAPSITRATAYLTRTGREQWNAEITAMILEHHKLSRYRGDQNWLVEPFRRADWIDVSRGLLTFGLPRQLLRQMSATWPSAGFHRRLVQLELQRLRTHPWSPLPMMRL